MEMYTPDDCILYQNVSFSAPSPVTNLSVAQVDNEATLKVTWSPVTPHGNCDLTYRVTWSFNNNTQAGSNTTSETVYTIRDLSYGTNYTVCVDPWVEGLNATQACQAIMPSCEYSVI